MLFEFTWNQPASSPMRLQERLGTDHNIAYINLAVSKSWFVPLFPARSQPLLQAPMGR